jgi:hypothetical protein
MVVKPTLIRGYLSSQLLPRYVISQLQKLILVRFTARHWPGATGKDPSFWKTTHEEAAVFTGARPDPTRPDPTDDFLVHGWPR